MRPFSHLRSAHCAGALLGLFVFLAAGGLAAAQGTGGTSGNPASGSRTTAATHSIRGKIFLPSGNVPDQRIRVVLELSTGGVAAETFSDSVGNFEFRSVTSNTYRVTVHSDGRTFETAQETVEVYGNFSRTFNLQVYLREKNTDLGNRPKEKVLSVADTQEVPKNAKKAYEKGVKLAREAKPQEAIVAFQEALKTFPDYLHALNKLGEQYLQVNQPAEAQALFEKAIAANNKFALPHINIGILLVNQQRYPEAVEALETGNRLDDSYPMAHLNLGVALMNREPADYERAERELLRALEMGGKNMAQGRLLLFNLYTRQKNHQKAAQQLEGFLKEAPNAPQAEAVRQRLEALKKMLAQQAGTSKNQ
jgi:tetratricopeptide (TPR) repeat protein